MPPKTPAKSRNTSRLAAEAFKRTEEAAFIFHRYDKDDSGTIDADELMEVFRELRLISSRSRLTAERMHDWFVKELAKGDKNKDGVLSVRAFSP